MAEATALPVTSPGRLAPARLLTDPGLARDVLGLVPEQARPHVQAALENVAGALETVSGILSGLFGGEGGGGLPIPELDILDGLPIPDQLPLPGFLPFG